MIVLVNVCMAICFFFFGALTDTIVCVVGEALEKRHAAQKALQAKMEKIEKLLESNLDKNENQ